MCENEHVEGEGFEPYYCILLTCLLPDCKTDSIDLYES